MNKSISISSASNSWIKRALAIQQKSRIRKQENVAFVEGWKELEICINCGFDIEMIFFNEHFNKPELTNQLQSKFHSARVNNAIFNSLVVRKNDENIAAIINTKNTFLTDIKIKEKHTILVLDGIEKPGNLGAIFRSADGAGIDTILLSDARCDVFNPNCIRASVGTVFNMQIVSDTCENILEFLHKNNIEIYTTFMENSQSIFETTFNKKSAIVLGEEHFGVGEKWKHIGTNINIPMHGIADSLNVSVAAALCGYRLVIS